MIIKIILHPQVSNRDARIIRSSLKEVIGWAQAEELIKVSPMIRWNEQGIYRDKIARQLTAVHQVLKEEWTADPGTELGNLQLFPAAQQDLLRFPGKGLVFVSAYRMICEGQKHAYSPTVSMSTHYGKMFPWVYRPFLDALAVHEFGHLFGLVEREGKTWDYHCRDFSCVMQQTRLDRYEQNELDRQMRNRPCPFCKNCLKELHANAKKIPRH